MKYILIIVALVISKPSSSVTTLQAINIYSGNCKLYKMTLMPPNHMKYTEVSTAFAKLVVDRTHKHLNFFYDGKLVFSRDDFDSYMDTNLGGEGFTSYNGVGAHSYPAEHQFKINFKDVFSPNDQGCEYEISNYSVN